MRHAQCSVDGARPQRKMASVYWSYRPDGGKRTGWKQFYCAEHYGPIHALIEKAREGSESCFIDGQTVPDEDAFHVVWATVYAPKAERIDAYVQCCDDCLPRVLAETKLRSQLLADREDFDGNRRGDDDADPWAAWR